MTYKTSNRNPLRLSALLPVASITLGGLAIIQLFRPKPKAPPLKPRLALQAPPQANFPAHNGKPVVLLPGNGRLIHEVASDFGNILKGEGFFNLNGKAAMVYDPDGMLRTISPIEFPELVEKFIVPARLKNGVIAQPHSLTATVAGIVLRSEHFLKVLPVVTRSYALPLPTVSGGVVTLPTSGYDPNTGVFTAGTFAYPTNVTAPQAREFLDELLGHFPFADDGASMAAVIGAALTLFCENLWEQGTITPAFFYSANEPGAGKSILASLAMIAVLGRVAAMAKSKDEEEMRKMLLAAAIEDQPVIYLDNVTGLFASQALESFLTASTVSGRILGRSKTETVAKSATVLITGNGCKLGPDMQQRTITVNLRREPATRRKFTTHLDEQRLRELRPQILSSLFGLVREWGTKGQPKPSHLHGRFPRWSEVVGGILQANNYQLPY